MKLKDAASVMSPKARPVAKLPGGLGGDMTAGAARGGEEAPKARPEAEPPGGLGADDAAPKLPGPKPDTGTRDGATFVSLVRWTSETALALGAADRVKAGQGISATTEATYVAAAARRLDLSAPGGGPLMDGVTAASWHATRSALAWAAAREWKIARNECDRCRKAKDGDGAWRAAVRAAAAIEALAKVQTAERPAPTKKRQTKRASLPKNADWQARIFEAATPAQRPGVAVLWATGCRPIEIEKGLDIMRDQRGRLVVVVPGAKVRDAHNAGQPQRVLLIDETTEAGKVLASILGDARAVTVQRSATRLNKDFAAIREKIGGKVSPYSMRHQAAAELKAELDPKVVAAALGHRSIKSQKRYGSVKQARGGGAILTAKATHPVREAPLSSPPQKPGQQPRPGG